MLFLDEKKNSTLKAQTVSCVTDMQKISPQKFSQNKTVEVYQLWFRVHFFYNETLELQKVKSRQIGSSYMDRLRKASLTTEGLRLWGENWIFQQDNVAIYNARRSKGFFNGKHSAFEPSTVLSRTKPNQDWGWMAKDIFKHGSQFETVDAIHEAVYECWVSILRTLMKKLIMSMPKWISELAKNGGYTYILNCHCIYIYIYIYI